MKTIKDRQILMAADFAGYPLKEAIKEYLEKKGWTVTDIGVKADSDPNDTELMFHRIGLRVGSMIAEKEFERALIFCGTGRDYLRDIAPESFDAGHVVLNVAPGGKTYSIIYVTADDESMRVTGAYDFAPRATCKI